MTIATAARECARSFDAIDQGILAAAHSSVSSEDGHSRYKIWAVNLGSLHEETDRRSADYRLRKVPDIVGRIVELLDELTETNGEILDIVSGRRTNRQILQSDQDQVSSDDDNASDELSGLYLIVGDIITSLFRISMLVRKATIRDKYTKAANAQAAPYLADFDIRHVSDKYSKLRSQPWLLDRLGSAITKRRQFLRYCRNHKKIA